MISSFLKKATPHLIAAGIFLVIAIFYCQPSLQGKVVRQHDMIGWRGMAQQSFEFKEKNGHFPLWTNSLFGGMPAFTVAMQSKYGNPTGVLYNVITLGLPKPANYFFLACLTFYFLCMIMRIRSWLGIIAGLAFAYGTYSAVIIAVGHETKMQAMSVMPAVIASILLLFQGRYWWGAALLALFFGFQVGTQHVQVVYYTLIIVGILTIAQVVKSAKEGYLKNTFIAIGLAVVAGLIGFGTYAVSLLPIQEYSKESIRGGREERVKIEEKTATKGGGLDKEYAFRWSYGIGETSTLLVPGAYGGSNGGGREYKSPTDFTERMAELGVPEDNALQMQNGMSYWGDQPNTSGPVYMGAVMCFLFIFGMVYLKSWHKWWIFAAVLFGIMLAWGRHFSAVNYFLFDYMPFYNKFRAPSISLIIPQLLVPLLSALAVDKLFNAQASRIDLLKKLKLSVYITGGILLVILMIYFSADFRSANDARFRENITMQLTQGGRATPEMQQRATSTAQGLIQGLEEGRQSKFMGDFVRSLILVVLAIGLLWAYIKDKLKPMPVMIGLLLLSTYDLLAVDLRYLNHDNYVDEDEFEQYFTPTTADRQIQADPNKPFRVFDQTDEENGPFNSSRASYFHNSVGGYHAAKMGLYNDLIEYHIGNMNMNVLNMLNTKYFMMNDPSTKQPVAQINPNAYGPVWLVKQVHFVKTPDEEIKALDSISLKDTAVVLEKFRSAVPSQPQFDSSATIRVNEYLNDKITYQFNATSNQFAVFSEIYYPRGWNTFIDGKKAEHIKVNYALRGMSIPAGQHTIEFRFEPESYERGNLITLIASI
ncbi:MAG: YfhO family protein, partial [Chitinophagaceae bacterium]